jgi:hypothetical protein
VLEAIREATARLVIIIDDAQVLLEDDGELHSGWQHFLNKVIEYNHQATLFIATRVWPGWVERKDSYLVQTDLEILSPETCVQVWKNLGYVDEQDDILREAAKHCGYNPRMMEIVAQNVAKPIYPFGWSNWHEIIDNEQSGLARFVKDPHYLSNAMMDIYPLVDEIVTTRLSPDARQLLAALAVSSLPLPTPLLIYLTQHPQRCIKELVRVSFLTRDPGCLCLLPLVAESVLQQLSQEERTSIEEHLVTVYRRWMREGNYRNEQEQAALIAELTILYLKQFRLLEAAELIIEYGWLSFQFGYASRVVRIVEQVIADSGSKSLTPQQEVATQLLHCRLSKYRGEKLTTKQRGHIYQQLYRRAEEEHIALSPAVEIYLMKPIVISLADSAQFEEAQALVNGQLGRRKSLQESDLATHESCLYYHAYLLARWGEYQEDLAKDQLEEASQNFVQAREQFAEAASLYKQCADLLRRSLRGAAPIEKSSISYKLARRLNDYAHYARRSKTNFEDIEDALQESIDLKQQGYTLPISLPISHAEYAQFFASTGQYRRASEQSDLALQQMEQLVQDGYSSARRELAVLQIERAELHLLLGNVDEAQQLFHRSKEYVQKSIRRRQFARRVEKGMQTIEQMRTVLPLKGGVLQGQLDYRWINRYKEIADYDTYWWLEPTGPFTEDEQREWNRLSSQCNKHRPDDDLKLTMKTALQRELDKAIEGQRDPSLTYPVIPIDLVRQKIGESLQLINDIESEESNIVVKSLYLSTLDEHLNLLRLIEACHEGDSQMFALYNEQLNTTPTAQEMEIATQELVRILRRGMASELTVPLSQRIFCALQDLRLISPYRDIVKECVGEHKQDLADLQQEDEDPSVHERGEENPLLSIDAVKTFFNSVFSMYGFDDWSVKLDPSALNTRVEQNTHELILPKKSMRLDKILHLLAHEIECHIYRSANGERSKLSLLSYGTANFLPTEEAFATLYSAQAEGKRKSPPWIGTLAVGLASGSRSLLGGKIRPQGFYELYTIMRDYHQLNLMLNGKDAETAKRSAHRLALSRCVRTWRGVPSPLQSGICFTKDNCYLRGYLLLQQELVHAQKNDIDLMERLQVGAIGVEHIQACEQLGIVKPIIAHKRLAFDPRIRQYIASFQTKTQAFDSVSPLNVEK